MVAKRIAVLVDGDNISASHSSQVLAEAKMLGRVDVARVYAASSNQSDWPIMPGYRLMHAGAGKNSADLLLCIDAMELALIGGLENFVIVTSDGDFTHIAQRLRERGLHVLGLGEAKTPKSFRLACTEFRLLETRQTCTTATAIPKGDTFSKLDLNIRTMIAEHSRDGRGMRIVDLAPKMHTAHGTRISTYPERNWRAYLTQRPALYELDPRGAEAHVRFRPEGFKTD